MDIEDDLGGAVVLRRELLAEGYTDQQIRARVRSGDLARIRHGAYVDGELWRRLDQPGRHRLLIRAVLKRAHPATVVTHASGAVERGAPVWGIPLDEVHVTRTDGVPGRREAGVVHHTGVLEAGDVEVIGGIPLSRPPRCAVEIMATTTVESALVTVNAMLHAKLLTSDELAAAVESHKHWPDTLASRIVVQLSDPRIQSAGESRTAHLCWAQHLPRPEAQVPVADEHGHVFAYVDFAWEQYGVFLEFDGREKYHRHRRANESLEEFLMREKRREERICLLTGWVCIRISWADLEHPERTAQRIRRILASRQGRSAPDLLGES